MKILFSVDATIPVPPKLYGGVERLVASLAEEYQRQGHTLALVAHPESNAPVEAFFPWPCTTNAGGLDGLRNALALRRAVQAFRPDVHHCFSRLLWLYPLVLPGSGGHFPILMSYGREPTGRTVRLSRRVMGARLEFAGCSRQIAEKGRVRGGGVWHAIPNFVDLAKLNFRPTVAPDAPLVFLSRIEPIKGCHTAIAIAKASGRRLLIAGNRVETGSAAGYWDREIAPHLGHNGIEYVGTVDDEQKNELLGSAAAMLVPIDWEEPFGLVFAEALACGTPVISCPRGALPEIVEQGLHGFLINSVQEGVAAVGRLGEISRAECRRRVEENFTLEIVAAKYLDLFNHLITR